MLTVLGALICLQPAAVANDAEAQPTMRCSEIHIRDPWILPYDGVYHLIGTTGDAWGKGGGGFLAYSSTDLVNWTKHGPALRFDDPPTWAAYHFWAPEMVERDGRFHLFYSGKTDATCRGTGVATSESPLGPFVNLSDRPLTPLEWECLDGHLFTDGDGSNWFIFVHEWVQCPVGEMWAQRISDDFTRLEGERHLLFVGKSAPWSNKVIDGPMMVLRDGRCHLFWSSFEERPDREGGYVCGVAAADSILGPYEHSAEPVIVGDGGHNCVFEGFDGRLYTCFHQPNRSPDERLRIHVLEYATGVWTLGERVGD